MKSQFLIPRTIDPSTLKRNLLDSSIVKLNGDTMGTSWSASIAGVKACSERDIRLEIESVFEAITAQMSLWEPNSEINHFNQLQAGEYINISEGFAEVFQKACDLFQKTEGAFSPYLAELTNELGFGPSGKENVLGIDEVARTLNSEPKECFQIPELKGRCLIQPGGIEIDLNAIAKGYAVDVVGKRLHKFGIDGFFVEIGGEGVGYGCKPDGLPWVCELERPPCEFQDNATIRVAMAGIAVASSGNYKIQNHIGDEVLGHIIDPTSIRPKDEELLSVTVFQQDCMTADALATALYVMGMDEGLVWAENNKIPAIFYTSSIRSVESFWSEAVDEFFDLE